MNRLTLFRYGRFMSVLLAIGFLIAMLFSSVSMARGASQGLLFWTLSGNAGTDPTTNYLGTTDNQPLVFKTNGIEAARIDSSGNVGISTSDPGAQLEIQARDQNTKQAVLEAFLNQAVNILEVYVKAVDGSRRPVIFFDRFGKGFFGNGLRVWANIDTFDRSGGSDLPVLETTTGPGPDANVIVRSRFANFLPLAVRVRASQSENLQEWQDSSANALTVVDASGKVGIGTSSPNSKLEISEGYLKLDTSGGTPPSSDCDSADEVGRMKVDSSTINLYICMVKDGSINWITK